MDHRCLPTVIYKNSTYAYYTPGGLDRIRSSQAQARRQQQTSAANTSATTPLSLQRSHLRTCVLARQRASAQRSVLLCESLHARAVAAQRAAHWHAARQRPAQCVAARAAAGPTVVVPHAVLLRAAHRPVAQCVAVQSAVGRARGAWRAVHWRAAHLRAV